MTEAYFEFVHLFKGLVTGCTVYVDRDHNVPLMFSLYGDEVETLHSV